jgi:hypothetical protein
VTVGFTPAIKSSQSASSHRIVLHCFSLSFVVYSYIVIDLFFRFVSPFYFIILRMFLLYLSILLCLFAGSAGSHFIGRHQNQKTFVRDARLGYTSISTDHPPTIFVVGGTFSYKTQKVDLMYNNRVHSTNYNPKGKNSCTDFCIDSKKIAAANHQQVAHVTHTDMDRYSCCCCCTDIQLSDYALFLLLCMKHVFFFVGTETLFGAEAGGPSSRSRGRTQFNFLVKLFSSSCSHS